MDNFEEDRLCVLNIFDLSSLWCITGHSGMARWYLTGTSHLRVFAGVVKSTSSWARLKVLLYMDVSENRGFPQKSSILKNRFSLPRCSMYGIFTYIYHQNYPNVGKYTIHRAFGNINHPFWGTYPYFWKHPQNTENQQSQSQLSSRDFSEVLPIYTQLTWSNMVH